MRLVKTVGQQSIVEDEESPDDKRYFLHSDGPLTVGYWGFYLSLEDAERTAELFRNGFLETPKSEAR